MDSDLQNLILYNYNDYLRGIDTMDDITKEKVRILCTARNLMDNSKDVHIVHSWHKISYINNTLSVIYYSTSLSNANQPIEMLRKEFTLIKAFDSDNLLLLTEDNTLIQLPYHGHDYDQKYFEMKNCMSLYYIDRFHSIYIYENNNHQLCVNNIIIMDDYLSISDITPCQLTSHICNEIDDISIGYIISITILSKSYHLSNFLYYVHNSGTCILKYTNELGDYKLEYIGLIVAKVFDKKMELNTPFGTVQI